MAIFSGRIELPDGNIWQNLGFHWDMINTIWRDQWDAKWEMSLDDGDEIRTSFTEGHTGINGIFVGL